jgi:hypothetical protein
VLVARSFVGGNHGRNRLIWRVLCLSTSAGFWTLFGAHHQAQRENLSERLMVVDFTSEMQNKGGARAERW